MEPFYLADFGRHSPQVARVPEGASFVFSEDLILLMASALKKRKNPHLRSTRYKGRAKIHFDLAIKYRVDV